MTLVKPESMLNLSMGAPFAVWGPVEAAVRVFLCWFERREFPNIESEKRREPGIRVVERTDGGRDRDAGHSLMKLGIGHKVFGCAL